MGTPPGASARSGRALSGYVAVVAVAGALATAGSVAVVLLADAALPSYGVAPFPLLFLAFSLLLFAVHRAALILHWRGHRMIVTLEEGLVYVTLLVFPAGVLAPIVFLASALAQAVGRREARKALFNVGAMSLTAAMTGATFLALVALAVPPALAAVPALVVYSLGSNLLVAGIFSILEGVPLGRVFRERFADITVAHAALGGSLGVATWGLWTIHPAALLALVPLLYFGQGYVHLSAQTDRELLVHRRLAEVANDLAGTRDENAVVERVLGTCGDIFHAGRATIELEDGRAWSRDFEGGPDLARPPLEAPLLGRSGAGLGVVRVRPTRRANELYGELEREMLRIVAGQTAAALEAARALHELADSRSRLELILGSAGEGILGLDGEDRITFANAAAERILGYLPGELVGKACHGTLAPAEHDSEECAICDAARGTITTAPNRIFLRKDGSHMPVEYVAAPIRKADEIAGAVVVFSDVTERRRAEEAQRVALERAMEIDRLKEINQFRTQLLNTASHELNTPLTPIRLQLHLLKSATLGGLNDRQQRAISVVDRNVERLSLLVQDVLDVARLQSGRLRLAKEPLDVNFVVAEAVEAFREPARQAGVRLDLRVAPGLWATADPHRLTQVLFNLLSNAIKFTPTGGRVAVETVRDGEHAVVRVADTGAGLSASQMERLFQPFSQVHEASKAYGGTGLGLYISKGIVEEHGGAITVASSGAARGATFSFTIPLIEAPGDGDGPLRVPRGSPAADAPRVRN